MSVLGKPGQLLIDDAVELLEADGELSISMLQRRFGLGYTMASRVIERLRTDGVIVPGGEKPWQWVRGGGA